MNIPSKADWKGYEKDLDLQDFYHLVFGKRVEDIYYYFKNGAYISRADELLYSNKKVFQYYIYAFAFYLILNLGKYDEEAKEVFLRLLLDREEKDKGSVCLIYFNNVQLECLNENNETFTLEISLKKIVDKIQKEYILENVDKELYDEIPDLVRKINKLCR